MGRCLLALLFGGIHKFLTPLPLSHTYALLRTKCLTPPPLWVKSFLIDPLVDTVSKMALKRRGFKFEPNYRYVIHECSPLKLVMTSLVRFTSCCPNYSFVAEGSNNYNCSSIFLFSQT